VIDQTVNEAFVVASSSSSSSALEEEADESLPSPGLLPYRVLRVR
jgi:hypothetical protein